MRTPYRVAAGITLTFVAISSALFPASGESLAHTENQPHAENPVHAENQVRHGVPSALVDDQGVEVSAVQHSTPAGKRAVAEAVNRAAAQDVLKQLTHSPAETSPERAEVRDGAPAEYLHNSTSRAQYNPDDPPHLGPVTAGVIQYKRNGRLFGCSGSVINTGTRNIVATAAHCIYNKDSSSPVYSTDVTYTPQGAYGHKPFGTWHVTHHAIYRAWRKRGSIAYDIALLVVAPQNGIKIQDATGANGWRVNSSPVQNSVMIAGYKLIPNTTQHSLRWDRNNARRATSLGRFRASKMDCPHISTGVSGGPWLLAEDRRAGVGIVYAVQRGARPHLGRNVCFAYPFRSSFKKLLRSAEQAGA